MGIIKQRIISIDPGIAITGYAIIDFLKNADNEDQFELITSGSIQTEKKLKSSERLLEIHNDMQYLLDKYSPDVCAIEQIFYFKNAKTIIPVCEARGVICMTVSKYHIPVFEYTPLVVKQTLTGFGRADKDEVKQMVEITLNNYNISKLDDTIDAIAIGICHARMTL